MKNTLGSPVGWSRKQKLVLRITVMAAIIVALVWLLERRGSGSDTVPADRIGYREATPAEWQEPLPELAEDHYGKELDFLSIRVTYDADYQGPRIPTVAAGGKLAWWWGPNGEALSYIPAPGEDQLTGVRLIRALMQRQGVRLVNSPDPELVQRIGSMDNTPFPLGWTLLKPPAGGDT